MTPHSKSLFAALSALLLATLACSLLPSPATEAPPTDTPTLAPLPPTDTPLPPIPTDTPEIPTATAFPVIASPSLTFIEMFDEGNGWATTEQYVLRTIDGGLNWVSVTPPGVDSLGFLPIAFFKDTDLAWLLVPTDPTSGTLYRTTNGGLSWTSWPVPFSNGQIQFLDASTGFVLSSLGGGAGSEAVALYRTNDGGANWTRVYINDPTVPGAGDSLPLSGQKIGMAFRDADHGWVGGAIPRDGFVYLYQTADGGLTWSQQTLTLPPGFENSMTEADAPQFFNPSEGILRLRLVSAVPTTVFYITFDGGQTWGRTFPINAIGRHSCANLLDIFLWDGGPALYFSHDGGLTWDVTMPNVNLSDTLTRIDFVNASTGWALAFGEDGNNLLYVTHDGGTTWTPLSP
ncbi:MAG: hypothetical protein ABWK53_03775 [Anaerolineales bacterium]